MRAPVAFRHVFVDTAPEPLDPGVLYVSTRYRSVVHLCACGCGTTVVTPLRPVDWKLIFDGVSISLEPSVGNWSLPCRSHYWIRNNKAHWAGDMPDWKIAANRERDKRDRDRYFGQNPVDASSPMQPAAPVVQAVHASRLRTWLKAIKLW